VQRIDLSDGAYLELDEWFLDPTAAGRVLASLLIDVHWEARAIRLFGREVMQPRLVSFVGDPDAAYTYSGVRNEPRSWTSELTALRERLDAVHALSFNAVLCNLYRDGRDAMGMHSDAEPELGPEPVVASISLGATRRFQLRHKRGAAHGKLDLDLRSGSLLIMRGTTQRHYRHGVPRVPGLAEPRINLTFRGVHPAAPGPHLARTRS
jgi:alkylated DNA repair dioxygenase AlkB